MMVGAGRSSGAVCAVRREHRRNQRIRSARTLRLQSRHTSSPDASSNSTTIQPFRAQDKNVRLFGLGVQRGAFITSGLPTIRK